MSNRWAQRPALLATMALLCHLFLVFAGARIAHVGPLAGGSYVRYDSYHYLTIATDGYRIGYCTDGGKGSTPIVGAPKPGGLLVYCGNAGWFPGYSLLVRAVYKLGANATWAAIGVSWALHWIGLYLVSLWGLRQKLEPTQLALLTFAAALFPGSIYYMNVFPVALTVLSLAVCVYAVSTSRLLLACAAAYVSAFSYTSGWLGPTGVAGCLAIAALREKSWPRFFAAAAVMGAAFCGVLTVFAMAQLQTGFWQAYFMQQSTFEHDFGPMNIVHHLTDALQRVAANPFSVNAADAWQTLVVFVLLVWCVVRGLRSLDQPLALLTLCSAAALCTWLLPKLMEVPPPGESGQVRYESLLWPLVAYVPRLPRPVQWALLGAFAVLAPLTSAEFFLKTIV